jgi:hypothetical protein
MGRGDGVDSKLIMNVNADFMRFVEVGGDLSSPPKKNQVLFFAKKIVL